MNTDFNISTANRTSRHRGLFTAVIICVLSLSGIFALGVFTGMRLEKVIEGDTGAIPDAGILQDGGITSDAGYDKPSGLTPAIPSKPVQIRENVRNPDDDEETKPLPLVKTPPVEKRVHGPQVREPKEGPFKDQAGGTYTVQTAALPDRNQAVALAAQLERKGYRVQISALRQEGRGPIYRVRIGRFNTAEEAGKFRDELEKKDNLNGFVTTIK